MLVLSQGMLSAKSALNAAAVTPDAFRRVGSLSQVHHIKWGTGVTSGAVTVEAADDPASTDTWTSLAVVTFAGTAPNQNTVATNGPYRAFRHRISTVLAGGTVSSLITAVD